MSDTVIQRKKYTITDNDTGETFTLDEDQFSHVPVDTELAVISNGDSVMEYMTGRVPYHIQMLLDKNLEPDEAVYQSDCFTGMPARDFSEFINTKVVVLGCAIIPHGPYKAFADKDNPSAPLQPGYLRCLFAVDDGKGDVIVLECNGTNVFDSALVMLKHYGWYLWDEPRSYMIRRGGKSNAYHMRSVHKDNKKKVVVESK